MMTFLYSIAGGLIGGLLLLVLGFFLIKFLIRRFLKQVVEQLGNLSSPVPPFRITLVEETESEWENTETLEAVSKELVALGYQVVGDFSIEEQFNVQLRGLANEAFNSYAVIYEYTGVGIIVDCACDTTAAKHLTVTTAPEPGLQSPEFTKTVRLKLELDEKPAKVAELHQRLIVESNDEKLIPAPAEQFAARITDSYAREMDWRVERGGISKEEVLRVAELQGSESPDKETIELVQTQWKTAISSFMDEKIKERFLRHITKMSAPEWEDIRDRLYIVHEQSREDSLVNELLWRITEDFELANPDDDTEQDEHEEKVEKKLKTHFAHQPVRQAFAAYQQEMPETQRYRRLAKITGPWPADVYVSPEEED